MGNIKKDSNFEIFNVGTGKEVSIRELINIFMDILNKPLKISVDKEKLRKVERFHLLADISKITNELGWSPKITLNEGIKDILSSVKLL
jgi:nucleoside-diphosphate-sugar epimerase